MYFQDLLFTNHLNFYNRCVSRDRACSVPDYGKFLLVRKSVARRVEEVNFYLGFSDGFRNIVSKVNWLRINNVSSNGFESRLMDCC